MVSSENESLENQDSDSDMQSLHNTSYSDIGLDHIQPYMYEPEDDSSSTSSSSESQDPDDPEDRLLNRNW